MIETHEFEKIETFLDAVAPWGESPRLDGYIFRGHSQESYELTPTALRLDSAEWFWKVCGLGKPIANQHLWQSFQVQGEYQILRDFYRLADQRGLEVPLSARVRQNLAQEFEILAMTLAHDEIVWIPADLYETAALAQHYGMPTRLLDWTYDLYVAMYFAFTGAVDKNGKITIWALNKELLSFWRKTTNKVDIEFITPHYSGNPNLSAQKGLFTHWPITIPPNNEELKLLAAGKVTSSDRRPLDILIGEQMKSSEVIFKKFILPCSEAKKGCQILNKLGYDAARIFPGYGGVAEQLLSRHRYY